MHDVIKMLRDIVFVLLVLLALPPYSAQATVSVNYPGIFTEDRDLPGIPSTKMSDYSKELVVWAQAANIPLNAAMADFVIGAPFTAGAASPVTYSFQDENGNTTSGIYFNSNAPIWHAMRDLVFLQTMQHSVAHWNANYIMPLGSSTVSLGSAYERAVEIQKEFSTYVSDGFFSDNHNPIVAAIIGSGSTSYANVIDSYGAIDSYWDGKVIDAIEASGSSLIGDGNFFSNFSLRLDSSGIASIGTSVFINYYKEVGDAALGTMMDNAATGSFAVLEGGLGVVFAPGQIVSNSLSYIAEGFADSAKGAHLVNHYYITKKYPNEIGEYLLDGNGVIDFAEMPLFPGKVGGVGADDRILNALASHNYHFNSATNRQIQAAYGISNLLRSVEAMDLSAMRKEIAAYAYLSYLKQHSFEVHVQRTGATSNSFLVSLPGSVVNDPAHGGYPSAISWYQTPAGSSQSPFPDASLLNPVRLANNQVIQFQYGTQSLHVDLQVDVTVRYSDGFTKTSRATLSYLPQHATVSLSAASSPVTPAGRNVFRAVIDPDAEASTKFRNVALYQRNLATGTVAESFDIAGDLSLVSGSNSYEFSFSPMASSWSYVAPGQYQYWLVADGRQSGSITVSVVDPEDTDADGLPDSWEVLYFGSITAHGPYDDPDGDGRNNYSEWKDNTDPTKTGAAEIKSDLVLQTHTDGNGQSINTFYESGELYANLYLQSGTLDLKGRTLTVHGDFIHSGGELKLNGGRLVVKGDYRIQTRNGDGSFGPSYGYLTMTNAADYLQVWGSFVTQARISHAGRLSTGTLEVKGDFTQLYGANGYADNFAASGTHRVLLSGNVRQTVTITNPYAGASRFSILEITNTSPEGILLATPVVVTAELRSTSAPITNSSNMHLSGTAVITQGAWNHDLRVDGYSGSWTMQQDQTVKKDFYLDNLLDLNGKTLTIEGSLYHSGGELKLNGGRLVVKGDYRIQTRNGDGSFGPSYGYLTMTNAADYLQVWGSFVTQARISHAGRLSTGTLEVKGDFTQLYGANGYADNFAASGTHRVLLSGDVRQTVTITNPYAGASRFSSLEITNTSPEGILLATPVVVTAELRSTSAPITNSSNMHLSGTAVITHGAWNHDLRVDAYSGSWTMQQDQTVKKDFYLDDNLLDLNGKTLTIEGSLYHSGGELKLNGGRLVVKGDYRIQTRNGDGSFGPSSGYLTMTNAADYLQVWGSFVTQARISHAGRLSTGTLEVKGDFTQLYGANGYADNFAASGTHRVLLSGNVRQTVTITNPYGGSSRFSILEITNTSPEGILLATPVVVTAELRSTSAPMTNSSNMHLSGTAVITQGAWNHDLRVDAYSGSWTMQQDQTVKKDFYLDDNLLDLNGKTLTIEGNLYHSGGELKLNGGRLVVKGDYRIQTRNGDGSFGPSSGYLTMTNAADYLQVWGSFVTQARSSHAGRLSAGTLEVKGDFTQLFGAYGYADNFAASGTHRVLLSGNVRQTVTITNPYAGSSRFSILEITNTSPEGILLATPVVVTAELRWTSAPITNSSNMHLSGAAVISQGAWNHDLRVDAYSGSWTLQQDQTVKKDFYLDDNLLDLNGKTLTIEGSLYHSGGELKLNGGRLVVKGDYRIQTRNSDGSFGPSYGYLTMTNAADYLQVWGSFVTQTRFSHAGRLSAGTLEVKGDFTQLFGAYGYADNFAASGAHRVLLSGSSRQTVSFANAGASQSRFNILEITNGSSAGVVFSTKIAVTLLFNHHLKKFTITVPSEFPDYDGDGVTDDRDSEPSNPLVSAMRENLAVAIAGTGGGSVTSSPGGIACLSGSSKDCIASFIDLSTVTLYATPAADATFAGWSGSCQGTGACSIVMDSDRSVTATFTAAPNARVGDAEYKTLQSAFAAAGTGFTIQAREIEFAENLIFAGVTAILRGGYNAMFAADGREYTVVRGRLMIRSGKLTVDRLLVR